MDKLQRAQILLDRFEAGELSTAPADAERLVVEIFEACGHIVFDKGFIGSDEGADCYVRTDLGDARQSQRAAAMYSLIVTAKMNGVDPQAWLTDVLSKDNPSLLKR